MQQNRSSLLSNKLRRVILYSNCIVYFFLFKHKTRLQLKQGYCLLWFIPIHCKGIQLVCPPCFIITLLHLQHLLVILSRSPWPAIQHGFISFFSSFIPNTCRRRTDLTVLNVFKTLLIFKTKKIRSQSSNSVSEISVLSYLLFLHLPPHLTVQFNCFIYLRVSAQQI